MRPLVGIRGWLLLYVAGACFAPMNAVGVMLDINTSIDTMIRSWSESIPWTLGTAGSLLVQAGTGIATVYGLYLIFTQDRGTRPYHITMWRIVIAANLLCAALLLVGSRSVTGLVPLPVDSNPLQKVFPELVVVQHVLLALISAVWWQYWKRSVRVANTFSL